MHTIRKINNLISTHFARCVWNPFRVTLAFKKKQKRFSVPSPHLLILCRHSSSSIRRRERPNNKPLNGGRGEGSDRKRGRGRERAPSADRSHLCATVRPEEELEDEEFVLSEPFYSREPFRILWATTQCAPPLVIRFISRGPPTRSLHLGLHFTVLEERNTRWRVLPRRALEIRSST